MQCGLFFEFRRREQRNHFLDVIGLFLGVPELFLDISKFFLPQHGPTVQNTVPLFFSPASCEKANHVFWFFVIAERQRGETLVLLFGSRSLSSFHGFGEK